MVSLVEQLIALRGGVGASPTGKVEGAAAPALAAAQPAASAEQEAAPASPPAPARKRVAKPDRDAGEFVAPSRGWKHLSKEAVDALNQQTDEILERARTKPFTLRLALQGYPQPVLRHLCIREKITVPKQAHRGQIARAVFVEAVATWLEKRAVAAETEGPMPVQKKKAKKQPEPEPASDNETESESAASESDADDQEQTESESEQEPDTPPKRMNAKLPAKKVAHRQATPPAPKKGAKPAKPVKPAKPAAKKQPRQKTFSFAVKPHESVEHFERDVAEAEAGNSSSIIWARIQATVKQYVEDGTLTPEEGQETLEGIRQARQEDL